MPKHRNKQHWNDWNPGFRRNNQQSAKNYQRNMMGQDSYNAYCNQPNFPSNASNCNDNLDVPNNYFQNYSKNIYGPSYQRNFTQNHNQSNFNQNYRTDLVHNARNSVFKPNFQRNCTGSSSSNINDTIDHSDLIQNAIKNVEKKSNTHPWYENQQATPPKQERKRNSKKTENLNEKGFIKKETLYKDPDIFYTNYNGNTDPSSNNEANDNWTATFWQKHDDSSVLEDSRTSQTAGKVSRKNQNRLERTLNDMLSKPAEMSKGKSLLQKMGWRGGGLGRDGDGITEPIAPKATYAVNTIGLGHLTEKPKKPMLFANMPDKKLEKTDFRNNFLTNVLLYILEFVKNDEENKIVFEPRFSKMERKRIHQIVEKIRVSDNLDDFDHIDRIQTSDKHLELVTDIWVHNCYELWTESEGHRQNRRLCLFKEAPAHVFLVTPEDLKENDESNDKNENDNETDDDIKKEKVSDTTMNYKEKCDGNQYPNEDLKNNGNNIKKEICESIDSQLDINMDKNSHNLVKNEPNTAGKTQKNGDVCKKIIPKMEINEQIIIISDDSDSEDEMSTNIDKNNEIMEEIQQVVVKTENMSEEANICDDIVVKMEINEHNTKVNENISDTTANINIHDNVKPKLENEEHINDIPVKIETTERNTEIDQKVSQKDTNIKNDDDERDDYNPEQNLLFNRDQFKKEDQKDTNESVLAKIVKYFKEFSSDETFKEFRFLGPFDCEEIMYINVFFDICMKQDDTECDEKYELLAAYDNDSVKFDVLEDNNGKRFIKKVGDTPELPSEDEEVIYASGAYI